MPVNEMSLGHRGEPYCTAWLARCREIGGKTAVGEKEVSTDFPQEMQRGLGIVLTVCIGGCPSRASLYYSTTMPWRGEH